MMGKKFWPGIFCLAYLLLPAASQGIEKIKYGTSVRPSVHHYLPVLAAEEKGIWKKNGLEAEWVPFTGGTPLFRAVAAGAITIGTSGTTSALQAAILGVPVVVVAELNPKADFVFWVLANSSRRKPEDTKGAKIGVSRLGVLSHVYGQIVAKALGLEKEVRFVATGGMPESVAALKSGVIDIVPLSPSVFINLKLKGEVRELLYLSDYLPGPWVDNIIFAKRSLIASSPEVVRRVVYSVVEAINAIRADRPWAVNKMMAFSGYSREAAEIMFEGLGQTKDGKINKKALENILNVMIEYRIVPREKVVPLGELFDPNFVS